MNSDDIDKLAFALLTSLKWAVDGGRPDQLPRVHEELSFALDAVFNQVGPELQSLKERRKALIIEVVQKHGGNLNRAAKELNCSRWTVHRAIEEKKIA